MKNDEYVVDKYLLDFNKPGVVKNAEVEMIAATVLKNTEHTSLIEAGYFKFGGDVKPEQHNYAGLGVTGGVPGYSGYASLEAARAAEDSYGDHIAQLIDKVIGIKVPAQPRSEQLSETAPEGMLYVIQVGAYKNLGNARKLQRKLEEMGVLL